VGRLDERVCGSGSVGKGAVGGGIRGDFSAMCAQQAHRQHLRHMLMSLRELPEARARVTKRNAAPESRTELIF